MPNNTHISDANQKLIARLDCIKQKYEEQMRHSKSAKVQNSCFIKINALEHEIKVLEKKEQKSEKVLSKQPKKTVTKTRQDDNHAEEAAKKAEEQARKAKAYASKKFESRHERSLPGHTKTLTRKLKDAAQQERKRTNLAAQTANNFAKEVIKQHNSPDFKHSRNTARFFDHASHQTTTPQKNKRFTRKI